MIILLFFAFLSGLVTIFAPCIWPLLPIILSSTTTGGHRKPLGITLGILISFGVLTLTISYIVKIIPFDPEILRYSAVFVIGFLGLTLLIPQLSQLLEGYVSRLSGKFGRVQGNGDGFMSGLITGISLGVVWTPCAGPILATIATLAATRAVSFQIVLVTLAYIIGVGIPLFIFAQVGQKLLLSSRSLSKYTGRIQQVFGLIMIFTALAIYTNYDKVLQAKLLDAVPSYSTFLNKLESNETVKNQLDSLKGNEGGKKMPMKFPQAGALPNYGPAPEFAGINNWINTQSPLTMKSLKGKVVLIDFWTYTCINCIRTLPYVTSWYEKYKDQDFVVIGVHTPEFEFEKKTENVEMATKQYRINYPVAQDNDYSTWNAYNNHYWPAHYLIDAEGNIRYTHFGEGEYEETEKAIRSLIEEAGKKLTTKITPIVDQVLYAQSPETYLGLSRTEGFYSEKDSLSAGKKTYTPATKVSTNEFTLGGTWDEQDEYAETVENSKIIYNFTADKVFLVIHPTTGIEQVNVLLDGKSITTEQSGADVKNGVISVTQPRLYEIVNLHGNPGNHVVELQFQNKEMKVFAFTFG